MTAACAIDSAEGQLLRLCARPRLTEAQRATARELVAHCTDWGSVVELASMHGVAALLLRHLKETDAPREAIDALLSGTRAAVVGSLIVEREIGKLRELFARERIEWLVVKGVPLSVDAYGEVGLRPAGDVDVLVREADAARTLALLRAEGFTSMLPLRDADWADVPGAMNEWALVRGAATVDLHWALGSWGGAYPLTTEEALAGRREVTCGTVVVPTLGLTELVVYLAVHAAKHFWERFEWTASFRAVAARDDVDWDAVAAHAAALRARRRVALGLRLVERLMGERLGGDRFDDVAGVAGIAGAIAERIFARPHDEPGMWPQAKLTMQLMDGPLDAMRVPLEALFAPRVTDWEALSVPRQLRFLFPLLRPFRLVMKYGRRAVGKGGR
ncbi:MAG: nucleotidyltransferase family protein [Thermoanaerobaculia bacterium]|nr:nucleotidyltransferase family protein [Thermoanaerobaculia bacterium]